MNYPPLKASIYSVEKFTHRYMQDTLNKQLQWSGMISKLEINIQTSDIDFNKMFKCGQKQVPHRATLNFWKFKVALIRMNKIFLNFAKSCILSIEFQF